jgi:Tol biopolymer transport system component
MDAGEAFPTDWSPDGKHLLFKGEKRLSGNEEESDIWLYSFDDDKSSPLLDSPYDEDDAHFSPDGKWFAYSSNESGQTEVYLQSFPKLSERRQVSLGGGSSPGWSHKSDELFYLALDGTIMAIEFDRETGQLKTPAASLFKARTRFSDTMREFNVTPDGQTFLINEAIEDEANASLSLITNWTSKIKTK